jgi:hypothetical protein
MRNLTSTDATAKTLAIARRFASDAPIVNTPMEEKA